MNRYLDPHSRTDLLRILVRLRGAETGESWLWYQGVLHGRPAGDVLRPVCGFTSVLCLRYTPLEDGSGYRFVQRESNHYYSLETGKPIGAITNPWTGKEVVAVGYVSPPWSHRYAVEGTFPETAPGSFTTTANGTPWPLETDGQDWWATESRVNEMGAGIDRETFPDAWAGDVRRSADVATYRAHKDLLLDPDVEFVPASLTVVSDTPWVLWLLMGQEPGHMTWYGAGSKVRQVHEIPGTIRDRVEEVHPGFLDDPWGIDGAPFASATQLRQLRAQGRI